MTRNRDTLRGSLGLVRISGCIGGFVLLASGLTGCAVQVDSKTIFPYAMTSVSDGRIAELRTAGISVRPLPVTSDGRTIAAWSAQRSQSRAVVLFCSGNGTDADKALGRFIRESRGLPLDVVVWNYRSQGEPPPTVAATRGAARAVYAAVAGSDLFRGKPIYVMGHSFGGWLALDLAEHKPVAGVAVVGAGTTVRAVADQTVPALLKPLVDVRIDPDVQSLDAVAMARDIRVPAFVVGSDDDDTMPESFARDIYQALPGGIPKHLVVFSGVGHQDYFARPDFWTQAAGFFGWEGDHHAGG